MRLAAPPPRKPPATPLVALLRQARQRLGIHNKAFASCYGHNAYGWLYGRCRPQGEEAMAVLRRIAEDAGMEVEPFLAGMRTCWGGSRGGRRRVKGASYHLATQGYAAPWLDGIEIERQDAARRAKGLEPLKPLAEGLRLDVGDLLKWKRGNMPQLRRAENSGWSTNAHGREAAFDAFTIVGRYWGWLVRSGIDPQRITLLTLVDDVLLQAFAGYIAGRNGGSRIAASQLLKIAMSLPHPEHGYIGQQVRAYAGALDHLCDPVVVRLHQARHRELRQGMPEPRAILEAAWLAAHQHESRPTHLTDVALLRQWLIIQHRAIVAAYKSWRMPVDQQRRGTSDLPPSSPLVRLAPILELPRPVLVVGAMIDRIRVATRHVPAGMADWLELERGIALLTLELVQPLRSQNLRHLALHPSLLTVRSDRMPAAYYDPAAMPDLLYRGRDPRDPDRPEHWRLRIRAAALKNRKRMQRDHDVGLPDTCEEALWRWIREVRPHTHDAQAGSRYFLPRCRSRSAGTPQPLTPLTAAAIATTLRKLTRLYLPALPTAAEGEIEEAVHWLRHVVATDMLKAGLSIEAVAAALLDEAEEIRRTYGHMLPADYAPVHHQYAVRTAELGRRGDPLLGRSVT